MTFKDKFPITEVKLARHTVQELFGQEDESGKWNLGIITRYLNPNSKVWQYELQQVREGTACLGDKYVNFHGNRSYYMPFFNLF